MNLLPLRFLTAGLLVFLIILSGNWLRRLGLPYPTILLALHELMALASFGFLIVIVYRRNQMLDLNPLELLFIGMTVLLFLSAIISGGLASAGKEMPMVVIWLHRLTPYLALSFTAVLTVSLLNKVENYLEILR